MIFKKKMVQAKIDRDKDFAPKLIGGHSDYRKKTGIYHSSNRKILKEFQKWAMTKTLVLIRDGEYSITVDPAKPCMGLTFHDYAGNRLMDFNGHVGVNILGYHHPRVDDMFKKIESKGVTSFVGAGTDFPIVTTSDIPSIVDLNKLLVKTARKSGFKKISKAGGWSTGTEVVENAMKVAYDWKKRKLFKKFGRKGWEKLEEQIGYPLFGIAAQGCFHGRTMGSLSMTRSKPVQYMHFPQIGKIRHIPYGTKEEFNLEKFIQDFEKYVDMTPLNKLLKENKLEKLVKEKKKIPKDLLAFIAIEPIQGEGGYRIPHKDFIKTLTDFCKKNDLIYIDDEIQAGMGRSGKYFAINHYIKKGNNIVFTMAKGLHVGALLIEEDMDFEEQGRSSTTTGYGRLADIAVGYAKNEAILENKGALMKNATAMGEYFNKELKRINNGMITRIENLGLLIVTDFETSEIRNQTFQRLVEHGIIPLSVGTKGIRWLPPLDVREQEIDVAVRTLEKVLKESCKCR